MIEDNDDDVAYRNDAHDVNGATEAGAPRRSRVPIVIALVVIVAGFGYLMYGGIAKNLVWNMTPNELLAQGPEAYDHAVRLGGFVVPGSVVHSPDNVGLSFRMRDVTGPDIVVQSTAIPTAMFREGIGVVVEGKYQQTAGKPVFHATTLMVKHSNEYKAPAGMDTKKNDVMKTLLKDQK